MPTDTNPLDGYKAALPHIREARRAYASGAAGEIDLTASELINIFVASAKRHEPVKAFVIESAERWLAQVAKHTGEQSGGQNND